MKTAFWMTGAALLIAVPASAQLLGGGLGGGLGGQIGGMGGMVNGGLRSTVDGRGLDRTTDQTRVARRPVRQSQTGASTDLNAAATVDGSAAMLRTRGAVAATSRGMVSAASTARGVAVFVPPVAVAAPAVAVAAPVRAYPAYSGSYYYGADPVVIHEAEVPVYLDRQQRDFERDLAGSGARVSRRGDAIVIALPADVTFAFDKADIRPRFFGVLQRFSATLATYPGTDVEVVGHTDSVGSETYNLGLSERRGRSVADYLVGGGVQPARLVVEAMGEAEPVATNATVTGRAANRRVELIVHPRAA